MSETPNEEAADQAALETWIRGELFALDAAEVGAHAATVLASGIELLVVDLVDDADLPEVLEWASSPGRRGDRARSLATSSFAQKVARVCRFAQTGDGGATADEIAALKRMIARVAEALFLPVVLLTEEATANDDEWLTRWWSDPGPIDRASPMWPVNAALHIARARILEREGEPPPALPLR